MNLNVVGILLVAVAICNTSGTPLESQNGERSVLWIVNYAVSYDNGSVRGEFSKAV